MTENYWGHQGFEQADAQQMQGQAAQSSPQLQHVVQPAQTAQPAQPGQSAQTAQPVQASPSPQSYEQHQPDSLGSWVLTLFLAGIPLVGLILMFVWAFGSTPDQSKKNWARANLVWYLVIVLGCILFCVVVGASLTTLYHSNAHV